MMAYIADKYFPRITTESSKESIGNRGSSRLDLDGLLPSPGVYSAVFSFGYCSLDYSNSAIASDNLLFKYTQAMRQRKARWLDLSVVALTARCLTCRQELTKKLGIKV